MVHPVLGCALLRDVQHAFRKIDGDNPAVTGIHRQGKPGPDADFEDPFLGLDVQVPDRGLTPFVEHFPENPVVDTGVRRVDPLDLV